MGAGNWALASRFAVVFALGVFQIANAAPITLKCVTSKGRQAADLIIDLESRKMKWNSYEYEIFHVDDTYISAYQKAHDSGGEVWMINRVTGEYKRAGVGIYFTADYKPGDIGAFEALTYEGRCVRQQF
jgi:hypothetical protein